MLTYLNSYVRSQKITFSKGPDSISHIVKCTGRAQECYTDT